MAESYYERRRRELGITSAPSSPSSSSSKASGNSTKEVSWYESKRMDLGMIPDTRPAKVEFNPSSVTMSPQQALSKGQGPIKTEVNTNPFTNNLSKKVEKPKVDQDTKEGQLQWFKDHGMGVVASALGKTSGVIDKALASKPGQFVDRFGNSAAELVGPTARPKADTGNKVANVAADVLGSIAGFTVNPAQIEQNLMTSTYNLADKALLSKGGQAAQKVISQGLQKANPALNRVGLNVGANTAQKVAENAVRGGLAGAAQNTMQEAARGNTDTGELIKAAGLGAVLGGAGDAAMSAAGSVIRNSKLGTGLELNKMIKNAPIDLKPNSGGKTARNVDITMPPNEYAANLKGSNVANKEIKPAINEQIKSNGEPILNPGQFAENSGVGITPFAKAKPYESLPDSTRSQLVTSLEREPKISAGLQDRLYTNLVDDTHPLKQFDDLVEEVLDKPLPASQSMHKLALATRGADMTAKQIITDAMVDSNGKVVGESLKSILSGLPKTVKTKVNSSTKSQIRKVSKDIYVDFEDYLINKHAITRAERKEQVFDKKLNWTPEYGKQKIAEYEEMFPEFKDTADKLYEYTKEMVNKWLVDTGMISADTAKAWFDANPHYVPNKRYFTPLEKRGGGSFRAKKGFANQTTPVKDYGKGGSERKIISPIESIIENTEAYVKAAKRNQVMQQAVRNIEADPERFANLFEIVKTDKLDDLTKIPLDGAGLDELLARFSEDFEKVLGKQSLDKDNIVRVLVNGKQVHVRVNDPQLLDAITALGPKAGNMVMDAVGWLTNKMKTLTTGANPVFSLTRNIFRDIPHAYISSKTTNNPIRFVADLADAAMQIMSDGELYKRYKRVGGGHSSSIAANRNLLAQSKRSVLPKSFLKDLGPRLYYGLENAMNAVESAPRLGEFKRLAAKGTDEDLKRALFEANDITVNFKRRGKLVHELDKVFPYMNAAIQGIDQIARLYKTNPKQATIKAFLGLTVPGAVLYALNYDNPDYQKVSNRVKDNFMLVPMGNGRFIKIAKPKELGTLFIDLPERLMRKFAQDDPAAFRDFADQLRTNFLPPGISGAAKSGGLTERALGAMGDTIMGPIADLAANENFAGSPIVPGYLSKLSPGLQADAKTTNVARWIGDKTYGTKFEQSPKKLDYLTGQYTGVLGQLGQPLLSPGGSVLSSLAQQVTTDPAYSNDISTEFYHYKDKIDQAYNDRSMKELPKWYNDSLRKYLDKLSSNMSQMRAEIRNIQNDKTLGNSDKRQRMRELQERINEIAETGNQAVRGQVPY